MMKPNLLIFFSFMDSAFDVVSKRSLLNLRSERFFSCVSSRSCIILSFTFSSMIHFECFGFALFVLVLGRFVLFCLPMDVPWFQHYFLKRLFFLSPLNCLCTFVENQLTVYVYIYF